MDGLAGAFSQSMPTRLVQCLCQGKPQALFLSRVLYGTQSLFSSGFSDWNLLSAWAWPYSTGSTGREGHDNSFLFI